MAGQSRRLEILPARNETFQSSAEEYRGIRTMNFGLEGKVAAVAASSSGLGKAVALALAREGASVALCSRSEKRVGAAMEDIRDLLAADGGKVPPLVALPVDLGSETGPDEFVSAAADALGPVDILVATMAVRLRAMPPDWETRPGGSVSRRPSAHLRSLLTR